MALRRWQALQWRPNSDRVYGFTVRMGAHGNGLPAEQAN